MMNKSTVTRVMNKVANWEGVESLGFVRLHIIPSKLRLNMAKALMLKGMDCPEILKESKKFLESLTVEEFKNWLTVNG